MYCEAILNYAIDGDIRSLPQVIRDGRQSENLSLDTSGFELIQHKSAVTNWSDVSEIEAVHYPEIRELAKSMTGCDWVLFYPAVIRNPVAATQSDDFNPVHLVHSDYAESYWDMIRNPEHPYHKIIMKYAAEEGITSSDVHSASRVKTIQFWRNVGEAVVDFPLGFCDSRSIQRAQLVPILVEEYGGLRTEFESFAVLPPDADEYLWYTFPAMQPDEVAMFRSFDSELSTTDQTFWTAHTAFADPIAGEHAAPRHSIEMRAICLFR